jgi:predicted transcriptional regulator of viral defense system
MLKKARFVVIETTACARILRPIRYPADGLLRCGKTSVAKGLGWALDRLGAPRRVTAPLARLTMDGVRVLAPTRPRGGRSNESWMAQENLSAGGDEGEAVGFS